MENQTTQSARRVHPLVAGASISVILVSLLGIAAITGVLPTSHGSVAPQPAVAAYGPAGAAPVATTPTAAQYATQDGRARDVGPNGNGVAPTAHHKAAHHNAQPSAQDQQQRQYTQNTYSEPVRNGGPVPDTAQQHPVQNYVSDMHPVGTGVGAVVGGLLGHQVGGGNGKTLATVAGALIGGYAGNEVAHNRSPVP